MTVSTSDQTIPSHIPLGWEVKKFGDVIDLKYGKALKKEDRCDGAFPVFGSSGIVGMHDMALVQGPGIVIGRKGNVGSVFWCDKDFFVIDTAYYVTSSLPLRYLFYVLPTLNFLNSDAAVPGLSRNQAYTLDVLIPPLPIQQRIASILSAYDELIENSQKRIKILESMARALYREWFVHFRYPGHEFVSLVPSSLGDIPQGWEVKNLGSLADIKWGDTSTTKESYVEKGYAAYSASGLDGQLDHYDFDRMGIVLSAIGAQCGKTWLASGKWSCIKNTIRFWAKNECVSTEFLFIATEGQDFWPRRGAAQPFISQGDAERIDVLIPDRATMERFTTFVADSLKHIATFTIQIQNLRRTRDLLLPRLLSGQINVEALAA